MSSEVFENREDDFRTLYGGLKSKLEGQFQQFSGESRKKLFREIERGVEEANVLIQEMEEEARKAPPKFRTQMIASVRNCRRDIDQLGRDMKRANSDFGGRPNIGFATDNEFERTDSSQRSQLFAGTESLNRASDSIARSQRVAAETDDIGVDIIEELGTQRESLLRTRDRLHETDSNLTKSRKVLNSMARRIVTNKMILLVIILLELGILGGVIYWKFFS